MNKLLIVSLVLSFFSPLPAQTCLQIWDKSRMAFDPEERLELLNAYIDSACKDSIADAFLNRGKIFFEFGDTAAANKDFKKAITINSNLSDGWYYLASIIYLADNSDSMGIILINHAIKSNDRNWKYFMLRGDILIARRDFKRGLIDYENSIQLINNSKNINYSDLILNYNAIGGTLLDLSVLETDEENKANYITKAIENLYRAIKIDTLFSNAYFLLGNALLYQKSYVESVNAYEKVLKINPNHPIVLTNLAIAYRETGKYFGEQQHDLSKALEYLEKSYALNAKDIETLRLLGVANGMSGENENALKWFLKAADIDPNNAGVWWNLGLAYGSTGNEKEMKRK